MSGFSVLVREQKQSPKYNQKGHYSLSRRKKLINNSSIPQREIEIIARCIYPDIVAFFESEEGQRKFAEWKVQCEKENAKAKTGKVAS